MLESKDLNLATQCIHAGQHPDPSTGAIMTPIYQTSTYVQDGPGNHKGYEYSRTHNPTRTACQANLAAIEGGSHGFCFNSGCAATATLMNTLCSGDHVIAVDDLYGGTYRLFTKVFAKLGIEFDFVDLTKPAHLLQYIKPSSKIIWIETPTNPMLKLVNIAEVTKIARSKGITTIVDNTFATPYLQQPLRLGADIVVHSTTKYLGGHSDVVGGCIVTNNESWAEQIAFTSNSIGASQAPFDAFLVMRGVKTLHVRMQRHVENAIQIADYLNKHPQVAHVYYPGLPNHPQYGLCKEQMNGPGGMLSFTIKGSQQAAHRFLQHTQLFACAESLGGVESLIGHPATMTHASIPVHIRESLGITDNLIRLSIGIESVDDLIQDLQLAFKSIV